MVRLFVIPLAARCGGVIFSVSSVRLALRPFLFFWLGFWVRDLLGCLFVGFCFVGLCVKGLGCGIERNSLENMVRRCKAMTSMGLVASHRAHHSGNFTFMRVPGSSRTGRTVGRLGNTRCMGHAVIMGRTLPGTWKVERSASRGNSEIGLCHRFFLGDF